MDNNMYIKLTQKNEMHRKKLYSLKSKIQKTREQNIRFKTRITTIDNKINDYENELKLVESNIEKYNKSIENYISLIQSEEKINSLINNLI